MATPMVALAWAQRSKCRVARRKVALGMRKKVRIACAAALGAGVAAFGTSRAEAQTTPTCASLVAADTSLTSGAATVYIAGSTASQIPLEALAPVIAAQNIAIIYQSPDSCVGVNDLISHTAETTQAFKFLDPAMAAAHAGLAQPVTCTVASPPPIDIAPSDAFPDTCASKLNIGTVGAITTTSTPIREFLGPIQAMTFTVPAASTANSISAEAAYVVFGYDAASSGTTVPPWSVPATVFTRPDTSGTLNLLGAAIGLAPTKFANAIPVTSGTPPAQFQQGTGGMQSALAGATSNVNATIGQLSYEAVVSYSNATALKMLAFQAKGQSCGYTPSSTASTLDMINVRQGRYAIWGPLHFIVNVDSSGNPLDGSMSTTNAPAVRTIMNYFLATGPTPPLSSTADGGVSATDVKTLITAEAKPAYVVPWCAMQASRSSEAGTPVSYQPTTPCGCYYESVLGVHTSSYCTTCTSDTNCSGSYTHCRYGYCEAQ